MSNLQEQYDILLNSIEFVDPSSYFLVTKTGMRRSNKKIYSLKEMVDLMFSETNDDNHLRIQIGQSLQGEKILYEHKHEFIEDSLQNRVIFIECMTDENVSIGDLLDFSEICHCSKAGKIKDLLSFKGHIIDKIRYDWNLMTRLLKDHNERERKHLSEEQFSKLILEKRHERMSTFYFKR